MKVNDEIDKLIYYVKHSYDDKDLVESLTLLEDMVDENLNESGSIQGHTDKLIVENAIEEVYRELHGGKYGENDLALGTRILESIRKLCNADYELCSSPKGYYTKKEREEKIRADERSRIVEHLKSLIEERKLNDKYGRQLMELIVEEIEEAD